MSRYVDADKLCEGRVSNDPVVIAVSCEPTADVKEVVRGEWIKDDYGSYIKICSICGKKPLATPNGVPSYSDFCPHCGADMRGDQNDKL